MYHLDNTSGVPEMPEPKEEQSISPRWFGESQQQGGISWPGADWFNTVQAELLNLLAAAEIQPDKKSYDQLSKAIPVLGDAVIRRDLASEGPDGGGGLVSLMQGGTVQNAIVEVYVDAFKPDLSGETDSTAAVMAAIRQATGGVVTSNYIKGKTRFAKVIFGNGIYKVGDIPLVSGVIYEGQGLYATQIRPLEGAEYCFTTVGTSSSNSDPEKRMAGAALRHLSIGCGIWEQTSEQIPQNTGGIYSKAGTYLRIDDVLLAYLDGTGLRLEETWDSDFTNVKIFKCGNIRNASKRAPGLYVGNIDNGVDVSNALRFRGLHIENCPQNLHFDKNARHIFLDTPKIESSEVSVRVSSVIEGVRGVVFKSPELTWQYRDVPMFSIPDTQPHFGLTFDSPVLISSTISMGYYFDHQSSQIPFAINNFSAFAIDKLITGKNFKLNGGEIMNCGPCIVDGTSDITVINVNAIVSVASLAGDGSGDVIRVNGGNVRIQDNNIYCAGSVTDASAVVNIGLGCVNPLVKNNVLRGVRQYGIRVNPLAVIAPYLLMDNVAASAYGALVYGFDIRYTTTSRNKGSGFGAGGVQSSPGEVVPDGSYIFSMLAGASLFLLRVVSESGISAGIFFADYQSSALLSVGVINGIRTGSGASGDGFVYLTKSGTDLIVTNHTSKSITCFLTIISAQS
ncbi:TPA: hypothetical protein ACQJX6_001708 [Raoultella ornithinolytica]